MAILYGTQSNGETLPVLVDQFGNLLAKGINGPEGPPGPQGPQGPQGPEGPPINLPPDPADGDALGWKDDQLAWLKIYDPDEPVGWLNARDSCQVTDSSGAYISPSNPLKYLEESAEWMKPEIENAAGGLITSSSGVAVGEPMAFYVRNSLTKVITLTFKAFVTYQGSDFTDNPNNIQFDTANIKLVSRQEKGSMFVGDPQQDGVWWWYKGTFMWTRPVDNFTVTNTITKGGIQKTVKNWFMGYKVEDAGTYAVRQQARVQEQVESLRNDLLSISSNSQ